jgi:hypothetical protein
LKPNFQISIPTNSLTARVAAVDAAAFKLVGSEKSDFVGDKLPTRVALQLVSCYGSVCLRGIE